MPAPEIGADISAWPPLGAVAHRLQNLAQAFTPMLHRGAEKPPGLRCLEDAEGGTASRGRVVGGGDRRDPGAGRDQTARRGLLGDGLGEVIPRGDAGVGVVQDAGVASWYD